MLSRSQGVGVFLSGPLAGLSFATFEEQERRSPGGSSLVLLWWRFSLLVSLHL